VLISKSTPPFIFETVQHAHLCSEAAECVVGRRSVLAKVLTNIYKRQARDLQVATAYEYLAGQHLPTPKFDANTPLTSLVADRLRLAGIDLGHELVCCKASRRLATWRYVGKTLAKVLANWLFAVLGNALAVNGKIRRPQSGTVVRAWVEVTEDLYPEEFRDSLVVVYPFDIKLKRQWRFLVSLRRRRICHMLGGYAYSPALLLRWLVTRDDRDRAKLELDASYRHAEWILKRFKPARLLTTDEFEPASFVMHEALMAGGVEIENKAHGVGKYSPFVSYSRFHVMNHAQAKYYAHFNPVLELRVMPRSSVNWSLQQVHTLVLVDQLVTRDGSLLDVFQTRILKELKRIGPSLGYRIALKLHPNSKDSPELPGVLCEKGLPWQPGEALFLTAYSTAYLSFEGIGPTWLVEDAVINPRLVFGDDARIVSVDRLEEFIRKLRNVEKRPKKTVHDVLLVSPRH
jgi:hypothetical protein